MPPPSFTADRLHRPLLPPLRERRARGGDHGAGVDAAGVNGGVNASVRSIPLPSPPPPPPVPKGGGGPPAKGQGKWGTTTRKKAKTQEYFKKKFTGGRGKGGTK